MINKYSDDNLREVFTVHNSKRYEGMDMSDIHNDWRLNFNTHNRFISTECGECEQIYKLEYEVFQYQCKYFEVEFIVDKENSVLYGKIIQQNEDLVKRNDFEFKSIDGFVIYSISYSQICDSSIPALCICGDDKSQDKSTMEQGFENNSSLKNWLDSLKVAMGELQVFITGSKADIHKTCSFKRKKIKDFMKWKRDEILKYQIEKDLELIMYFNKSDEKDINNWCSNDVTKSYKGLDECTLRSIEFIDGLHTKNCPYCVLYYDIHTGCKADCGYAQEHGFCNRRGEKPLFVKLKGQGFLDILFKSNRITDWWKEYDKLHL